MPELSIIIVNYKSWSVLEKCIESISSQNINNNEIIIVDNNSDDKTRDEISQTNAKYILEKKQGYGYAIKTGLNNANGNYFN